MTTPELSPQNPLDQLKSEVDAMFAVQSGEPPLSVTRYVGGYEDKTLTILRDPVTENYHLDYHDSDGTFEEGEHAGRTLTKEGHLINPTDAAESENQMPFDPVVEVEDASSMLEMLSLARKRPLRSETARLLYTIFKTRNIKG